jgi:hypothetical protein
MRLTYDLRQHLGVIVSQANELFTALDELLEELLDTEEARLEAIEALSREERRQAAHYFTLLSQRFYDMHELIEQDHGYVNMARERLSYWWRQRRRFVSMRDGNYAPEI